MIKVLNESPLAMALNQAIQLKLGELGWASGDSDTALAEFIVLLLVDQKEPDQVLEEITGGIIPVGPEDPSAKQFVEWLFDQIEVIHAQIGDDGAEGAQEDYAMDDGSRPDTPGEITAPTGPRSMRGGSNFRGGREKRMVGQINRTLNQSSDSVLHRTRGPSGIARGPPTGPRMGAGRQPRVANNRTASVAHGLAAMNPAGPVGMNGMNPNMNNGWGMIPQQPTQMDMMAMLEQQQRMIQQMLVQQGGMMPNGQQPNSKSLFERVQKPAHNNFRGRGGARGNYNGQQNGQHTHHNDSIHAHENQQPNSMKIDVSSENDDSDMKSATAQLPMEEIVCKYNLACTNRECKFAHQSPVAPPGTTVDVKDACPFGAACKNRKCVGRHPSPATSKTAHLGNQAEQDCRFFPNCTNPRCPFRHPTMPPCRNGGECKVPNCKFTHVKTACKFRPCTNRFCPFSHEEGQRGTFHDKVWVAGEERGDHVSERKFVDEGVPEETVLPDQEMKGAEGQDVVV